ncbi:MAG TPA: DUF167 domain-containing protein [Sneathiellales bacterium]|nr:DUF167 domain-containing protein [Sneathiellales bacterium]
MPTFQLPFTIRGDRVRVLVRVTPKASRIEVSGTELGADGRTYLKVRVTTASENGKANRAVIKLLAKLWGAEVTLISGATARLKALVISGDATSQLRHLQEWLKQHQTGAH